MSENLPIERKEKPLGATWDLEYISIHKLQNLLR